MTDPLEETPRQLRGPAAEKRSATGSELDAMFAPSSVAVIGATERPGTVGRTVLSNLLESPLRSRVYPVNPTRADVLGVRAYKSVGAAREPVDLAVIVTPAATVPGVIGECVDAGVKAAVVISAGFRERGARGVLLEQQIQQQLRPANCAGGR